MTNLGPVPLRPPETRCMRIKRAVAARGDSITVGIFVDGVPYSTALGLTVAEFIA